MDSGLVVISSDARPSDSPFVEFVWHSRVQGGESFMSRAESHWEMVVTNERGKTTFTVRGPESKASLAPVPREAEVFGIVFGHGIYMPHLPVSHLVDDQKHLPAASGQSFWLHGSTWEFPTFDNADTFIERLVRYGMLAREPVVEAVLQGQLRSPDLSLRSVQRRFVHATGLTHGTVAQIQRAQQAAALLEQGVPILDTVERLAYADQPHLTRSLRRFIGHTPAQILRLGQGQRQGQGQAEPAP